MSDNSTNVVPFNFGKQQVRTLLIDDQPWFVATDVASALLYAEAKDMTRNLDDDEKGRQIVPTPGGDQELLVINESGLYSAILRSRKAEAKRFKKWVTAEVLPAIRKHGRYEDRHAKMPTLIDELIGMSELSVIKGLIRDKGKAVTADKRQSFALTMHNRLHTRFNVPRTELIPVGQFESACNFIAAYALEGEYIEAQPKHGVALDRHETHHLYLLMSRFAAMFKHKNDMLAASRALGSTPLMGIFEQLKEGDRSFQVLDRRRAEIYGAYSATGCQGGYAWRAVA
ncbi:Bro-N domain-containing protein [Pseudomonas guariconensis]|uniref:BRO-N domain-containing protein n=1 Tax=Pseudomonas guariconensis TaxID=1288410 RepID=UPI0025A9E6EE|nr:Bro-N domain-containing protein [Pseudomonas guariconensis]MDM9594740.1 Bro-N domain-containing protein [Pseudomonas guariconensis]MDM9607571.1 Bro-N domain-containing protein [Pseudomonas guariconensis]MDM9612528.1 Bro-N domain-containing protein [Pseudomonas guariconensis]